MKRAIISGCLVAVALASSSAAAAAADEEALRQLAHEVLARLEQMRGQKLSRPLAVDVKTKPEVEGFIQERLKEEYGPALVAAEGRMLQLLGLLPADMVYGEFITRLLTEQVAGFYDHTRKSFHIASWLPAMLQEPVMAHEIFHAIQDMEWDGGKLIDSKGYTHDEVLAHAALLEGDATIVMLNYQQAITAKAMGVGLDEALANSDVSTSAVIVNLVAATLPTQMSSPQFPIAASAPDYLKQGMIFPYQQGLLFISALRRAGWSWKKIRNVYADPPRSTEQILHPERYYGKRDDPSTVTFGDLGTAGFRRTWDGVGGEFHLRQLLLLAHDGGAAAAAAEGWDGDYTVLEVKGDGPKAPAYVAVASTWDSEADAEEFATALQMIFARAGASALAFDRRGTEVYFAVATDAALAAEVVAALPVHTRVDRH